MSALLRILTHLYRGFLRLYPPAYRVEYGAELLEVFDQALQEAGAKSSRAAVLRVVRELCDLPGVLIRTHLNWRQTDMDTQIFPRTSDQTSWPTAILSLTPYLILGPLVTVMSYHPWWDPQQLPWVFPLFIGLACLAISLSFIVGAIHKFPRWSYPSAIYLILMLTFLVTYLVNGTAWDINSEGGILFLVMGLLFVLSWLLPPLRPLLANLRLDWTLLSYGMYACSLLLLSSQDHDEVPYLNWVALLPTVIWIAGALAHLRLASAKLRVGVLLLSVLLGLSIWWSPVIAGNSSTLAGFLVVSGIMLAFWAVLAGLVLAPILIGVITYNRLSKRTPA
jgi:hypothetical protein